MQRVNSKINSLLFLYLALSPIYWIPFLNISQFNSLIKTPLLLLIAFCLVFFVKVRESKSWIYRPFFLVILTFLPVVIFHIDQLTDSILTLITYAISFLIFRLAYFRKFYFPAFPIYVVIFYLSLVCLDGFVSLGIPMPSDSPRESLFEAGFAAKRTGWSNSIALMLPITLMIINARIKRKFLQRQYAIAAFLLVLISQILCGGRAGIIGTLIVFFAYIYRPGRLYLLIAQMLILGSIVYYSYSQEFVEVFRIQDDIYDTSANRLIQYIYFFDMLKDGQLFGLGHYGTLDYFLNIYVNLEFHNVWLRSILDFGIIHGAALIILMLIILKDIVINRKLLFSDLNTRLCVGGILGGFIMTNLESRFIIGNIQNSLVFFFYLGIIYSFIKSKKSWKKSH